MEIVWLIFVTAIGLCAGSFLNVVIYRVPRGKSVVFPGSHCPYCGKAIRWYDNLPIMSWLILRGRCRQCGKPISPRYILVEALTGLLIGGLFAWYFVFGLRYGAGEFQNAWPMFVAHAALVAALLACSIIDIEMWIVPLEICWIVSLVGIICSTASPHEFMPAVSPQTGALSIGAVLGLAISLVLVKMGVLRRSFADAEDAERTESMETSEQTEEDKEHPDRARRITSVAIGAEHGVNPRREVLHELLFLLPAIVLSIAAFLLVTRVDTISRLWMQLHTSIAGENIRGLEAALFGYLVGGAWIWGLRIFGTLGFGKEAMGLGDVHILAAVGAVTGWVVPSVTFFVAPFFALLWALHLWMSRKQRELPYGPWLAVGTLTVMLFYDGIVGWLTTNLLGL